MADAAPRGHRATLDQLREFWDADAETYDRDAFHHPVAPLVRSAWRGSLESLLPAAPASVLDVGAGTGFLSLMAAELGHPVTAVDLSKGMLGQLREKAEKAGLAIEAIEAEATAVPAGPFDVVISRHLIWTLLEPLPALRAWRAAAPQGRLVLIEGLWGSGASPRDRLRHLATRALAQARRTPSAHHASYASELCAALPHSSGTGPETLLQLVVAAGWPTPRVHRLRDVDWAVRRGMPWPERELGPTPCFAIVAGR